MNGSIMQRNKFRCPVVAALLLTTMMPISQSCRAQNITIVGKSKIYKASIRRDSAQRMTELRSLSPDLVYDLRYASANNFTGQRLYRNVTGTYLRLFPAKALASVQDTLRSIGLGLKIFDAYRPHA